MKLFAGIDVGSSATKAVVVDQNCRVLGQGLTDSGADFVSAAQEVYRQALDQSGGTKADVAAVVSTGYGRTTVDFATGRRTEIDCHGRGAYYHFSRAITVVDIGGQDNKVIQLDGQGQRLKFAMNRKCAAGTGSFIEEMALRLKVPLGELSQMATRARGQQVKIGSYCTVFAMTEILAKIRSGVKAEDLARAALESVARRVLETQAIVGEVVATGGVVAHNPVMQEILTGILKTQVFLPPDPQHIGALGAALRAAEVSQEVT